jgi:hypothetical protein
MHHAFVDQYTSACRLPYRAVDAAIKQWPGSGVFWEGTRGIPFGLDRVLPVWAGTMARQHGLSFSCAPDDIAELFGLDWRRREIIERLQRFATGYIVVARQRREYAYLKRLWPVQELKIDGDVCRLVLGVQFELEKLIPVSLDVIRGCVAERSIGALDFYLWLMSRAHQQRPRLHHELSGEICPPWSRPRRGEHDRGQTECLVFPPRRRRFPATA